MYIVFEGIDGAGKSTQIKILEKWLKNNGLDVETLIEPTDSDIGKLIHKLLKNNNAESDKMQKILALLFAADRMLLTDKLENNNKIILSDRSYISSLAYQKNYNWIKQINKHVKKPDLVLLLDVSTTNSTKRTSGEDKFENPKFLENVKSNYLKIIKEFNHEIINANNEINKVTSDIKKALAPHIKQYKNNIK